MNVVDRETIHDPIETNNMDLVERMNGNQRENTFSQGEYASRSQREAAQRSRL